MKRLLVLLMLLVPSLAVATPLPPDDALPNQPWPLTEQWVDDTTGFSVHAPISQFWASHGGLVVFGRPISAFGQHQWFERNRIEQHPQNHAPYDLQLGLIGKELLERNGRNWQDEARGESVDGPCREFTITQRTVCGPFLRYWESHGLDFDQPGISADEALALFGLPLTAPKYETNSSGDRVLTQWFERARFEYHPNNPPTYQVLLGRLGAELNGEPPTPIALQLAPPRAVEQGRTFVITVTAPTTVSRLNGVAGTWPISFVRQTERLWVGLGGVEVLQELGPLKIQVAGLDQHQQPLYAQAEITVTDGQYESERIILPPEVNDNINKNREKVNAERAAVNAIWPQFTNHQWWNGTFILPTEGRISSEFGTRRAYDDGPFASYHEGLDIANATGTPIYAAASGRIAFAQEDLVVRGGAVIIDHGFGVHTGYWHMDSINVAEGYSVIQGEQIGLMGGKGFVTAPHLHWDVRIGGLPVDPEEWVMIDWGEYLKR